jgi:hypothetical protein
LDASRCYLSFSLISGLSALAIVFDGRSRRLRNYRSRIGHIDNGSLLSNTTNFHLEIHASMTLSMGYNDNTKEYNSQTDRGFDM